jgi:hypothetical protein
MQASIEFQLNQNLHDGLLEISVNTRVRLSAIKKERDERVRNQNY